MPPLPPIGGSLTLRPEFARDHHQMALQEDLVFQQPGEVMLVDQHDAMAYVRFAPGNVANPAFGWVSPAMIETSYATYWDGVRAAKGYGKGKGAGRSNADNWRQ